MGMDQSIRRTDIDNIHLMDSYEFRMRNEHHINNWFDKNVQEVQNSLSMEITVNTLDLLVKDIYTVMKSFSESEEYGNSIAQDLFVKNHYSQDFDIDFIEVFLQDLQGVQNIINQAYADLARGIDVRLEYYVDW